MKKNIVVIVFALVVAGCVVPKAVQQRVDLELPKRCADTFKTTYQQYAGLSLGLQRSVFVVARLDSGKIAICNIGYGGVAVYSFETVKNYALAACEETRLAYMARFEEPLKRCEVYAIANDIQ